MQSMGFKAGLVGMIGVVRKKVAKVVKKEGEKG